MLSVISPKLVLLIRRLQEIACQPAPILPSVFKLLTPLVAGLVLQACPGTQKQLQGLQGWRFGVGVLLPQKLEQVLSGRVPGVDIDHDCPGFRLHVEDRRPRDFCLLEQELDVGPHIGDGDLFRLLLGHAFGDECPLEFLLALVLGQLLALVTLALVAVPSRRSGFPTPLPLGCCCQSTQLVHGPCRGRKPQTGEVRRPW